MSNKQQTTEIVHGNEKIVDRFVQFLQNTHRRIDVCVDNTWLLLVIEIKQIRDAFIDAKRRGVTIRYITEITKTNHGGKIWAQNNNDKRKCGATFSLSLPLD